MVPLGRIVKNFICYSEFKMRYIDLRLLFIANFGGKMLYNQLDDIPGVGEKGRKQLLKHFGSLKKIKEATIEDI